mmetsp:Transcript_18865/g.38419  ORF Transcript_18865/g.38419 Transcript_18865/m.38419 type:complete len:282 (-) Transcript_18865:361-1206(-)
MSSNSSSLSAMPMAAKNAFISSKVSLPSLFASISLRLRSSLVSFGPCLIVTWSRALTSTEPSLSFGKMSKSLLSSSVRLALSVAFGAPSTSAPWASGVPACARHVAMVAASPASSSISVITAWKSVSLRSTLIAWKNVVISLSVMILSPSVSILSSCLSTWDLWGPKLTEAAPTICLSMPPLPSKFHSLKSACTFSSRSPASGGEAAGASSSAAAASASRVQRIRVVISSADTCISSMTRLNSSAFRAPAVAVNHVSHSSFVTKPSLSVSISVSRLSTFVW